MDKNTIRMQSKYSQNCKSCSKQITLNEKVTYLCTKCKLYFCEECAVFLNDNESNILNNCPGGVKDPHDSIMVKITRNIKEYLPIGISIDDLERNEKSSKPQKNTLTIIEDHEPASKQGKMKILDD